MKIFGIFGDPIEHSLSPAMQNAACGRWASRPATIPFACSRKD